MFAFPVLTNTAKKIIIMNIVLWVAEVILLRTSAASFVTSFFLFPNMVLQGDIWQLLTYSFFHSPTNIFHLILNMLVFYFFSFDLERKWGTKRFLFFYIISAFIGGIFVVLEGYLFIPSHFNIPTLGASASIFALTTAFALNFPNRDIYFFFFPLKAKYLIHIDLVIILLSYLSLSESNISNAAHLGGMFCAFLIIKTPWYKLNFYKSNKKEKVATYIKRVK